MRLRDLYTYILNGKYDQIFTQENLKMINDTTISLLNKKALDQSDLESADLILRISNILYNNTDLDTLPLDDGIYDLLLECYKKYNPNFQVGSEVVHFNKSNYSKSNNIPSTPSVTFLPKEVKEKIFINSFVPYGYNKYQEPIHHGNEIESDRARDTAHKYPNLVGTLDKCKFVTDAEAMNAMVYKDSNVKIFERDFLAKHLQMGLFNYSDNIDLVGELKYDGISIEAEVCNHIVSARTRGDLENDLAADLTGVLYGYRFPNTIPDNEVFGMKFEAIITKYDLFRLAKDTGKVYRNMRTAISGILGLANARDYIQYITLVPLATSLEFNNRIEELEFMNRYFAVKEPIRWVYLGGNFQSVLFAVNKFTKEAEWFRDYMGFAYDGVVISYINKNIINFLGRENHVNKYSIAIKFNPKVRTTHFRGYEYTVGKNGTITPMILFDPVEFNGTIHYKASGHSYERFKMLSLRYNDLITISYNNDVMPYVTKRDCEENRNNPNPIERFIGYCPSCGTTLIESFSGKTISCPNKKCRGRHIAIMVDMLSKINFRDFSEEYIKKLNIGSFTELMHIHDVSQVSSILGSAMAQKFIDQINILKNKRMYDYELVGALGFSDISIKTWATILKNIKLIDIVNFSVKELSEYLPRIKGIGEATTTTIINEMEIYKPDLEFILTMPNVMSSYKMTDRPIVAFTGFRNKNLESKMIDNGYDVSENLTKKTNILVIPYEGYTSKKVETAMKYGIKILTESQIAQSK